MIDCSEDYRSSNRSNRQAQLAAVVAVLKANKPDISYEELLEIPNPLKINKYRFAAMCRHVLNNPWPFNLNYLR